jgi:toxin ParE1/3/4
VEIRWLDDALTDATEVYRYIADDDARAAARVLERIRTAVRLLAAVPHRGRPGRWPGTGELVVPRTPYIVPYRVRGEIIEILRVFHSARRWPDEPSE